VTGHYGYGSYNLKVTDQTAVGLCSEHFCSTLREQRQIA
jgi:hypothetical protein